MRRLKQMIRRLLLGGAVLLLSGCMDINRTAARLAGCQGDIYATPPTCAAPPTGGGK